LSLLSVVRSWLGLVGVSRGVGALTGPKRMKLLAKVVTTNCHASPITGLSCAFGVVEVGERVSTTADGNESHDWFRPIGGFTYGAELEVESELGERVTLPANGFQLVPAFVSQTGTPLTRGHPLLDRFIAGAAPSLVLQVRETTLGLGDRVRVEGTITQEMRATNAGYRSGMGAVFVGVPPLVVREIP